MTINKENFESKWNQIESGAPKEEPARQYYFMKTAKELLKGKFQEELANGEALNRYGAEALQEMTEKGYCGTCCVTTFGCRLNIMEGIV